jgi:hypothetical protein
MLLIPGTFDLNIEKRKEEDDEIVLIQKWDGYRPKIVSSGVDFILRPGLCFNCAVMIFIACDSPLAFATFNLAAALA